MYCWEVDLEQYVCDLCEDLRETMEGLEWEVPRAVSRVFALVCRFTCVLASLLFGARRATGCHTPGALYTSSSL